MGQEYWLFRRAGAKRWTYAWAPEPNKRKQVLLPETVKTKAEARAYAEENEAPLRSGVTVKREIGPTVQSLFDKWEKLYTDDERAAKATIDDAIAWVRNWVLPDLGPKQIDKLDVPAAREWLRALRVKETCGRTIAPYSVRNVVAGLAAMLDTVEGEGWARLPAGNVARAKAVRSELPEMRPRAGRSQKLRIKDVALAQRLIDCPDVPLFRRVRYIVELTTGLRDGEILGLRWSDLALDAKTPHGNVKKAIVLRHRDGHATRGKLKTEAAERAFPLHPAAVAALREWKREGWEAWTGKKRGDDHLVFASARGTAWRPRSAERFREDATLAGLPTEVEGHPLTFHALRRSFASWLKAAGAPDDVVSALLGHAPKGTAGRHYTEEDVPTLAAWVLRIDLRWVGDGG